MHAAHAGHVWCVHGWRLHTDLQELKSIHLRTLNRVRAEMLFSHHLAHGTVRPRYSCSHLRTQSCIYWPWGVLARATLESIGS